MKAFTSVGKQVLTHVSRRAELLILARVDRDSTVVLYRSRDRQSMRLTLSSAGALIERHVRQLWDKV